MDTNVMLLILGVVAIYFVYRLVRSITRKVLWLATTAATTAGGSAFWAGANASTVNPHTLQNFAWVKKLFVFFF